MSSVFGLFVKSKSNCDINYKSADVMRRWNMPYGQYKNEVLKDPSLYVGCCLDRINENLPKNEAIIKSGDKIAVIDVVLYNREEIVNICNIDSDKSDEELLFIYIDKFGYNALKDVNGDFCGAIYDKSDKSLVLFRDHMGIRPLFYYYSNDIVGFSTDIRGIAALDMVDVSINEEWLYKTISGYYAYDLENTEFKSIFCVKPGCFMTFKLEDNLEVRKEYYWRLGQKKIKLKSDKEYQEKLKSLVEDSVKKRLDTVSGLVGAELSGGLDSGVIDILINRFGRKCTYISWAKSPNEVKIIEHDERLIIEDICKQEGIKCNYAKMNLKDIESIRVNMENNGFELDENEISSFKYVIPPYVNTLPLCHSAQYVSKSGAKVIFSGHGGDEGVSHRGKPYEMFHHHEFYHYFRYMYSTTHYKKHRILNTLRICKLNLIEGRRILFKPKEKSPFYKSFVYSGFADKFKKYEFPLSYFNFDPIKYINNGGSRSRLDNTAMLGAYCNVRYMLPYLDYRVIDYAVSIPRYQYLRGNFNRYIFREAFKDIMPHSLYVLKEKRDVSDSAVEPDPDWFQKFSNDMKMFINRLDRNYWSQYINYDLIDEWLSRSNKEAEYKPEDDAMMSVVFTLAEYQNLVEKTRGKLA